MVANKMYSSLNEEEKNYLHIYNYVAKDQKQPIHNKFKKRSCHSESLSYLGRIATDMLLK